MASKRPSLSESMKTLSQEAAPDPGVLVSKNTLPPSVAARAEMKKILIPVDPVLHKKLKILSVEQERTLEDVCRSALIEYMNRF